MEKSIGIYTYYDTTSVSFYSKLPDEMIIDRASIEGIIVRLLLGHLNISKGTKPPVNLKECYLTLPFKKRKETYDDLNNSFSLNGTSVDIVSEKEVFNVYFRNNRKNHNIHISILLELSGYFTNRKESSISAFAHLYRCLEYISFTFPLIYASKSSNYSGTFEMLKKFFQGENEGELKFLKKFIRTLFEDEDYVLNYKFNIELTISSGHDKLVAEINKVYQNAFNIDNNNLIIEFSHFIDFFTMTRNRYFHLLIGSGQENFKSFDYDVYEYFDLINEHCLNFLSMIIMKIVSYSFYSMR